MSKQIAKIQDKSLAVPSKQQLANIGAEGSVLLSSAQHRWIDELRQILISNFRRSKIELVELAVRLSSTKQMFAIGVELNYEGGEQGVQFFVEQERSQLARYPSFMMAEQLATDILHRAASRDSLRQLLHDPKEAEKRMFNGFGSSKDFR